MFPHRYFAMAFSWIISKKFSHSDFWILPSPLRSQVAKSQLILSSRLAGSSLVLLKKRMKNYWVSYLSTAPSPSRSSLLNVSSALASVAALALWILAALPVNSSIGTSYLFTGCSQVGTSTSSQGYCTPATKAQPQIMITSPSVSCATVKSSKILFTCILLIIQF